jgi:hypothetical protein
VQNLAFLVRLVDFDNVTIADDAAGEECRRVQLDIVRAQQMDHCGFQRFIGLEIGSADKVRIAGTISSGNQPPRRRNERPTFALTPIKNHHFTVTRPFGLFGIALQRHVQTENAQPAAQFVESRVQEVARWRRWRWRRVVVMIATAAVMMCFNMIVVERQVG